MSDTTNQLLRSLLEAQVRIEAKLDALPRIEAQQQVLVDALREDEPQPLTLEGDAAGRERDQSQSLDNDGK